MCSIISAAALHGAIFGGGASSSRAERPPAGVSTTSTTTPVPSLAGGTLALDPPYAGESIDSPELGAAIAQVEIDRMEAEHLAAERASAEAERLARIAAMRVYVAPGQCCGPHSDAWWHGIATCEQGGRNDPYYGFFSFMDGSQGGKPWEEQVAAGNALLARAGREVPTWAQSCVNAGYTASPSG